MSLNWALWRLVTGFAPARPLGVFRAVIGVAALITGLELVVELPADGALPGPAWPALAAVWLAAAAALLVGYGSRAAAAVLAGLTGGLFLATDVYSNHMYLLGVLAFLLSLSDCGAAASLESRRRGAAREHVRRLPVVLIRIQVSVVYLFAGIGKINAGFISGNVLFARAQEALIPPDLAALAHVPLWAGLALTVIVLELFIAVGLWFERSRPAAFGLGLALHAGMVVMVSQTLQQLAGIGAFALLVLSGYVLFLDAPVRARVVVWDETCRFCSTWVRWFRRLDWLAALRFVPAGDSEACREFGVIPERTAEAIQLVDLDGRVHGGFEAVRRVLGTLPLCFLWAPYLALAPVRALGARAYRAVAARRACRVAYAA